MRQPNRFLFFVAQMLFYTALPLYAATPWLHADGNQIKDPSGNVVVLRGVALIDLGFLEDWHALRVTIPNSVQLRIVRKG